MLLIGCHSNEQSAARSIAENRASKIRSLLADDHPRCTEIARRNAQRLAVDVAEYIADSGCSIETARSLCNVVTIVVDATRTPAEHRSREIIAAGDVAHGRKRPQVDR